MGRHLPTSSGEVTPESAAPAGQFHRRLALVVEYDGARYAGFQFQNRQPTIQGAIETALNRLTGETIRIRAASRTDSGAHALGQVVDFQTGSRYPADTFLNALNYYLPVDIRVQQAFEMQPDFHSRRDAASRIYRYRILNRPRPSPLRRRECCWIREPLQIDAMNEAAQALVGTHDFRPLALGHPPERSAVRTALRWEVSREGDAGDMVVITCEANGFLRHQIRRANAILVEIGKGKWPKETMRLILQGAEPTGAGAAVSAGTTAEIAAMAGETNSWPALPAHGLCLVQVTYRDFWSKVKLQDETN